MGCCCSQFERQVRQPELIIAGAPGVDGVGTEVIEPEVVESTLQDVDENSSNVLKKINQYSIEVLLGKGSYGSVYRAGERHSHARVHRFATSLCALSRERGLRWVRSGRVGQTGGDQGARQVDAQEGGPQPARQAAQGQLVFSCAAQQSLRRSQHVQMCSQRTHSTDARACAPAAALVKALMREIAVMKRLNHPNCVALFEVIDDRSGDR
jgi:serine/threonine protein kinase